MNDRSGALFVPCWDDLAVADAVPDEPTTTTDARSMERFHVSETADRWVCGVWCAHCEGAAVMDVRRMPRRCPFCRKEDWQADGDGTRRWA